MKQIGVLTGPSLRPAGSNGTKVVTARGTGVVTTERLPPFCPRLAVREAPECGRRLLT